MNAREQGRRAARSLTTVLALSGVALVGGLGVAAYTSIEAAKTAPVRAAGSEGTQATAPATNPPTLSREHEGEQEGDDGARAQQAPSAGRSSSGSSSSSGSPTGSTSSGSGVSGGSGSSQTSSSGS